MKKLALFLTLVLSISASAQLKEPRLMMFDNMGSINKMNQNEISDSLSANGTLKSYVYRLREIARSPEVKTLVAKIESLYKKEIIFEVLRLNYETSDMFTIHLTKRQNPTQVKVLNDLAPSIQEVAEYDKEDVIRKLNYFLENYKNDLKIRNAAKDFSKVNSKTSLNNDI